MARTSQQAVFWSLFACVGVAVGNTISELLEETQRQVRASPLTTDEGVRVGLRYMIHDSPRNPFWMAVPYKMKAAWQANNVNDKIWDLGIMHDRREAQIARAVFSTQCDSARKVQPLVADVGANSGFFSLLALAHGCRASAYEPIDLISRFIQLSVKMNDGFAARFKLYQKIVSAGRNLITNGWMVRTPGKDEDGASFSAKKKQLHSFRRVASTSTVSLDDTIDEDVLYLKVDVEGHEPSVFESAQRLLATRRVSYLLFECTYYIREFGHRSHLYVSIMRSLESQGFLLYHLQGMSINNPTQVHKGMSDVQGRIQNSSDWFAPVAAACASRVMKTGISFCQLDIFAVHRSAQWPIRS